MHTLIRMLLLALLATGIALPAAHAETVSAPALPDHLLTVAKDGRYRVAYDIQSSKTSAGVARGLYFARGMIEALSKQGVAPSQLDIHLVLHDDAAFALLKDEPYQIATKDPFAVNVNDQIVQRLLDLGVSVEICNSMMKFQGWKAEDILPGVTIVHDAYTRLIKLQNDGYAYIGGF